MDNRILSQSRNSANARYYTTLEGRIENALDKAAELGYHAVQLSDFSYQVRSSRSGHASHIVEVTVSGLCCDCESARFGNPCFHAATVARRLQRERKPTTRAAFDYATGELFDEDGEANEMTVLAVVLAPKPSPRPRARLEDFFA